MTAKKRTADLEKQIDKANEAKSEHIIDNANTTAAIKKKDHVIEKMRNGSGKERGGAAGPKQK